MSVYQLLLLAAAALAIVLAYLWARGRELEGLLALPVLTAALAVITVLLAVSVMNGNKVVEDASRVEAKYKLGSTVYVRLVNGVTLDCRGIHACVDSKYTDSIAFRTTYDMTGWGKISELIGIMSLK